jgi:uncharacterized protein YlzI (FlbEa/FlbD family)
MQVDVPGIPGYANLHDPTGSGSSIRLRPLPNGSTSRPICRSKSLRPRIGLANLQGTDIVIILTRLGNGLQIAVNPDLIERAEHTPDTVITLIDGHKLVVEEPLDEVIRLIRNWRASIAAEAVTLARLAADETMHTSRLSGPRGDAAEMETSSLADQSVRRSPFGQVLRLPSREV